MSYTWTPDDINQLKQFKQQGMSKDDAIQKLYNMKQKLGVENSNTSPQDANSNMPQKPLPAPIVDLSKTSVDPSLPNNQGQPITPPTYNQPKPQEPFNLGKAALGFAGDVGNSVINAATGGLSGAMGNALQIGAQGVDNALAMSPGNESLQSASNALHGIQNPVKQVIDAGMELPNNLVSAAKTLVGGAWNIGDGIINTIGGFASDTVNNIGVTATGKGQITNNAIKGVNQVASGIAGIPSTLGQLLPHDMKEVASAPFQLISDTVYENARKNMSEDEARLVQQSVDNAIGVAAGLEYYTGGHVGMADIKGFSDMALHPLDSAKQGIANVGKSLNAAADFIAKPKGTSLEMGLDPNMPSPKMDGVVKKLVKAGVDEPDVAFLRNLNPEQVPLVKEYIQHGVERLSDPNKPSVFGKAAEDLNSWWDQAQTKINDIGKQVGDAKPALQATRVPGALIKNGIEQIITDPKYGVKVGSDGVLDFSDSTIPSNSPEIKMIQDAYDEAGKTKTYKGDSLERATTRIDKQTNFLSKQGFQGGIIGEFKGLLNKVIGESNPDFADVNQKYAKIMDLKPQIESAANVNVGDGNTVFNGEQVLRRSLGTAATKSINAIGKIGELADLLGIEAPKDLQTKANIADFAEKTTSSAPKQSMGGLLNKAAESAKKVPLVGQAIEMAGHLKEHLTSSPITERAQKISSIINGDSVDFGNALDNTTSKFQNAKLTTAEAMQKLGTLLESVNGHIDSAFSELQQSIPPEISIKKVQIGDLSKMMDTSELQIKSSMEATPENVGKAKELTLNRVKDLIGKNYSVRNLIDTVKELMKAKPEDLLKNPYVKQFRNQIVRHLQEQIVEVGGPTYKDAVRKMNQTLAEKLVANPLAKVSKSSDQKSLQGTMALAPRPNQDNEEKSFDWSKYTPID